MNRHVIAGATALVFALSGCHGNSGSFVPSAPGAPNGAVAPLAQTFDGPNAASPMLLTGAPWSSKIQHVIIVFQENRSVDNLFNGYKGADTQTWGLNHLNKRVNLVQVSETAPYDVSHAHWSFVTEFNGGKMNGFDLAQSVCNNPAACPPAPQRPYAMVPRSESKPYWDMARQWVLADKMFQTNQGPSFPAHQYIVSGTSTISNGSNLRAAENPHTGQGTITGGCDSPVGSRVVVIDRNGNVNQKVYPCFERTSLTDLLDNKNVGWRYYENDYKPGLWVALDAIKHIRQAPWYKTKVVTPSNRVLTDINSGNLAAVSWVMPSADDSDHARVTDGTGPSWVASIVNAVGRSKYWKTTAIFVTWDDWGGFYDHVKPPVYNSYELGFRVPLLVISPYAKAGFVSHKQHEFGSILKFVEETYGLGSLNTTDVRADDLTDCFNFNQPPRKFYAIKVPVGPQHFFNAPPSDTPVDDDF